MLNKNEKPFERKNSEFTTQLIDALKSSELLSTTHCDVRNESYWYLSRKRLGAKRQMRHIVKQNVSTNKWESYMFRMEPRKSDYEVVPQRVLLKQDHNSRVEALKHCELMAKERDQCPGDNKKMADRVDASKLLNTHFRILIVSPAFERLDQQMRIVLVYKELLRIFGTNAIPALYHDPEYAPPEPVESTPSSPAKPGRLKRANSSNLTPSPSRPASRSLSRSGSMSSISPTGSVNRRAAAPKYVIPKNAPYFLPPTPNTTTTLNNASLHRSNSNGSLDSDSSSVKIGNYGAGNTDTIVGPLIPTPTASKAFYNAHVAPSRIAYLTSTFGANVCNLSLFRYLLPGDDQFPFELIIDARTPSQWKPEEYPPPLSERFGSSHTDRRASRLPKPAKKVTQMKRIKGLATKVTDRDRQMGDIQKELKAKEEAKERAKMRQRERGRSRSRSRGGEGDGSESDGGVSGGEGRGGSVATGTEEESEFPAALTDLIAESLGVDPYISGVKMKKTGGLFGHHFHDMKDEVRDKVLATAKDNKLMIKSEGFLAPIRNTGGSRGGGSRGDMGSSRGGIDGGFSSRSRPGTGERSGMHSGQSGVDEDRLPDIHQRSMSGAAPLHSQSLSFDGAGNILRRGADLEGDDGSPVNLSHQHDQTPHDRVTHRHTTGPGSSSTVHVGEHGMSVADDESRLHTNASRATLPPGYNLESGASMAQHSATLVAETASSIISAMDKHGSIGSGSRQSKKGKKSTKAISADYDKGTHTETEMLTEMFFRTRAVEKCAIRLQRQWRIRTFHRAIRWHWKHEHARITIQRVYRGHFVRNYYHLFRKIAPLACMRIQRSYRAYVGNKLLLRWRALVYRMTRRVLPWIKLFFKKCYESWVRRHEHQAAVIQSATRMYLYRTRYFKALGQMYIRDALIPWAATTLQRIMRGKWGRRRFAAAIAMALFLKIDCPCCLRLQRCYRGYKGRMEARQKRRIRKATILLQRNVRTYVRKVWVAQMEYEALRLRSATHIQRMYRGHYDRDLYWRRKHVHWYTYIFMPSVLKVQATARMHAARVAYLFLKLQHTAASHIQRVYKKLKARAERLRKFRELFEKKRVRCAVMMQKTVRMHQAIVGYKRMHLARAGQRIVAGKVIIRAWRNFVYGKRLQILLDEHRLKLLKEKGGKMESARLGIIADIDEIKQDIDFTDKAMERLKVRLKLVDTFLVEAGMRIPVLQMELAKLTNEDFERGWAESYGFEYESLNYQLGMAREERRLLKHYIMRKTRERLGLYGELEDAEWELDSVAVLELANAEALRRSEVGRIERRVLDRKKRALREERCRWKIDSIRRNVIERNRKNLIALAKQVKSDRGVSYAQTMSYEQRAQQWDKEDLKMKAFREAEGRKLSRNKHSYEYYAQPVQKTFDNVIANSLSLLRNVTLEQRSAIVKDHFKVADVEQKKAKGGQFSALKPENQPQGDKDKF